MDKELLARIQRMGGTFKYVDKTFVSVAAGGASDSNLKGVNEEGKRIAIENGVRPVIAKLYFIRNYIKVRVLNFLKNAPGISKVFFSQKTTDNKKFSLCYPQKDYLYDLYRWTGKTDFRTRLHWMGISKYRVVYLFRKCKKYKDKNKVLFCFWRAIYGHYSNKYGVDLGTTTQIGAGFIIRHVGSIAINGGVIIGNNVEILQGVTIGYERRGKRQGNPTIGDRVWIGSNAIIVGNIKVGNNVLIAPGAFVNFDVPDNSIVIGNPGKIIPSEKATEGYVINTLDL